MTAYRPWTQVYVAAAYLACGWLGMALTIESGSIAAIFPPAGIAFACLLILGVRFLPAIVAGAFIFNAGAPYFFARPIGGADLALGLVLAGVAAAQAALAARLVRRNVPSYLLLDEATDIFKFLVLGGPIACLVPAVAGTAALFAFGVITRQELLFSFWTWWVGNVLGVVVVSPLALVVLLRKMPIWRERLTKVGIPTAVTLVAVAAIFLEASQRDFNRTRNNFLEIAAPVSQRLQANLAAYLETVTTLRLVLQETPDIDRDRFDRVSGEIRGRRPAIQALEWVPRVTLEARTAYESGSGRIKERAGDGGFTAAGARAEYYPVRYAFPLAGNEGVIGFDLGSDSLRREAMRSADKAAAAAATGRIDLVQITEKGRETGILVFEPVYDTQPRAARAEQPGRGLRGYVVGALRIEGLIADAAQTVKRDLLQIEVVDASPGAERAVLYGTARTIGDESSPGHDAPFIERTSSNVAGRTWTTTITATETFVNEQRSLQTWLTFAAGVLLSGLLQALLLSITGQAHMIKREVDDKTVALASAKQAAETANAAKSRFLALISHELRTPMTGVLGITDLLLMDNLPAEQRSQVGALKNSAHSLLNLLNDLLDFAKIEADKIELETNDFSPFKVLQDVAAILASIAAAQGNTITIDANGALLPTYRGDAGRFRQVVMNLVGNAIKFTSNGAVEIHLRQRPRADGRCDVAVAVTDTGVGISPDAAKRLFRPFVQGDASTSRKFGGTGLGLAISRRLAELMGGGISVTSEPGRGSTFTFTAALLPTMVGAIAKPDPAPGPPVSAPPERPLRILLAEDNETNRQLFIAILTRMGHAVTGVADGSLVLAAATANTPDVILMDMQMPVMDGEEATRRMKALDSPLARIPVIAITADTMADNHQRYLAAGAVAVVTKPVDWTLLAREMARLTRTSVTRPSVTRASGADAVPANSPAASAPPAGSLLEPEILDSLAAVMEIEKLRQLVVSFRQDVAKSCANLKDLVTTGDTVQIRKTAHAVKGVALQFGAAQLAALALDVEKRAAQGAIAEASINRIPAVAVQTYAALEDWLDAQGARR